MEAIHVIGGVLGISAAADLAHSALPHAPVVAEPPAKPRRVRSRTASVLYRIADAVSPPARGAGGRPRLAGREGSALLRWDESPCRPSPTTSA
jgi:hypothetical protein